MKGMRLKQMITDAIAHGLQPDFAARATKGVICNASQLLANPNESSARIVREMIDYGGLRPRHSKQCLHVDLTKRCRQVLQPPWHAG